MTDYETLDISVTIRGEFWDNRPEFSLWFDGEMINSHTLTSTESYTINFARTLAPGDHVIDIRLLNKTPADTVVDKNNNIIKDMILSVEDIVIDDISLDHLLWQAEYLLDRPQQFNGNTIDNLPGCVDLGWNGTYRLTFTSPFYIWLLERL